MANNNNNQIRLDEEILNTKDFRGLDGDGAIQSIKVIGVGGGGNNAVSHMYRNGIKDVSFVLINTDRQVLEASEVPTRVLIGTGRGAGGKPEVARKYAEESAEKIADLFATHTDMVFITAGMGGGTGTGAAPVVARIAKEKGILTVGIVTLPFNFEGPVQFEKAYKGAAEMAKNVDSLLLINNQRLSEIYRDLHIINAFARADDTLLNAAQSITDIITKRGIINRDFNDVDSTLRNGGTALISSGYGEGEDRVTKALQQALESPLLRNTDIMSSKNLMIILYISDNIEEHPYLAKENAELDKFIHRMRERVDVKFGLYTQSDLGDRVRVTILASGFKVTDSEHEGMPVIQPMNQPEPSDVEPEETGKRTPALVEGKVLNPEDYDDPTNERLRALENTPATNRSPFSRFRGNNRDVGNGARFRGIMPDSPSVSNQTAPQPESGDDKKGLTLDFSDC